MLCTFERLLYPQTVQNLAADSFMIAIYRAAEKIPHSDMKDAYEIKAVGYNLPVSDKLRYDLKGRWGKSKYGRQFEVERYDEVVVPTKEGIIAYLSSGQIQGVGPVIAERIYDEFGDDTLQVLDKEPERLLTVSGVSQAKLIKIKDSYLESRGARDVLALLLPYGITAKKALRFYREYGKDAVEVVKEQPYRLCEIAGIGFLTADKIAMSVGFDELSPQRVDEGILYTLRDAETKGHLCLESEKLFKGCLKLLNTKGLTEKMVRVRAGKLVKAHELVCYGKYVFRLEMALKEHLLAELIHKQLQNKHLTTFADLETELDIEEKVLGKKLAPEQRAAVKMALTNGLSIITGGPGTGKTLIQKAILDIYKRNYSGNGIRLAAPTGRAARRMAQSTGEIASTVHRMLALSADEDGMFNEPQEIEADLILVDEVSMLDIHLAVKLFSAIRQGAQVVLIGDADQLPSVGPGAVLSELIASECIPVVKLDKVFRQAAGSRIAINAKLIRHGTYALEYGEDFQFIDSNSLEESAKIIQKIYLQETLKHGVDNVALLTPYRQKTETGVNALNVLLRDKVNIPNARKAEVQDGKRVFRVGDKVMQTKNYLDVNNGDIGYIKDISTFGEDTMVQIDFGDDRIQKYNSEELEILDWGYATTIHKSQGDEYNTVILNLQLAHAIMLTRPLLYTAITRGKNKVIIVGEKRALCIAINRTDTEKRGTCLAKRIKKIINDKEN